MEDQAVKKTVYESQQKSQMPGRIGQKVQQGSLGFLVFLFI